MVHAIESLFCPNGHYLPITFDRNNCGCHDDGKPCIIVMCSTCLDEWLREKDEEKKKKMKTDMMYIPLDKSGMKIVEQLLKNYKEDKNEAEDQL